MSSQISESEIKTKETVSKPDENKMPGVFPLERLSRQDVFVAVAMATLLSSINLIWLLIDHHVLIADEAGHVLNSLAYRDLFEHSRILRSDWWTSFLTVNQYYPPFVYVLSGFLKSVAGAGRMIDGLVVSLFTFLLTVSSMLTMRMLGLPKASAICAGLLLAVYPLSAKYSHTYMLEYPALSMIGVGIFSLCMWWQRPTLVRSILCGLVLAMCCLTKQIVAGFLIFPGLFFLIAALMDKDKLFRIKGTITVAVSTILFALPWLIANWGEMMKMESTVKVEFAEAGMSSSLFGNLFYYAGSLWWSLSPSLCLLFVASILLVGPKKHLRLLPIWASSLGGLLFISSWTFRLPDERYLVPGLLIAAVCSSVLVGQLLHQTRLFPKLCVLFLLLAGICSNYVQFFDRSFVDRFAPVRVFAGLPSGNGQAPDLSPVRFSDWGYSWVFSSIEKIDGQQPVYLNVLTNLPELNAHTFELEVKERNLGLRPTTSRVYTCGGDQVEFNRETALYYEWYLIKTGNQGYRLKDKKDVKNLSLLEGFIASGGEYYLVGSRTAPDGAILKLYRKIIM